MPIFSLFFFLCFFPAFFLSVHFIYLVSSFKIAPFLSRVCAQRTHRAHSRYRSRVVRSLVRAGKHVVKDLFGTCRSVLQIGCQIINLLLSAVAAITFERKQRAGLSTTAGTGHRSELISAQSGRVHGFGSPVSRKPCENRVPSVGRILPSCCASRAVGGTEIFSCVDIYPI